MYKQTYVYISQEHQILHIKESHTNGKYAQENHMVLSVYREKRTKRRSEKAFWKRVIKLRANGRAALKKTRMGSKRVSGWCNSMCNGPVAERSMTCRRRWKSSKNKTYDVALNCSVREGPDHRVPFRSVKDFCLILRTMKSL